MGRYTVGALARSVGSVGCDTGRHTVVGAPTAAAVASIDCDVGRYAVGALVRSVGYVDCDTGGSRVVHLSVECV